MSPRTLLKVGPRGKGDSDEEGGASTRREAKGKTKLKT